MSKERRLGRGLEALLGRVAARTGQSAPPEGPAQEESPATVPFTSLGGQRPDLHHATPIPASPPSVDQLLSPPGRTPDGRTEPAIPPRDDASDPDDRPAPADRSPGEASVQQPGPVRVDLRLIDGNPSQPRQDFDDEELQSLAESLQAHGLLQPVVVRRSGDRYQVIAGERRLRAAARAGWTHVPIQVIEADDRQMAELAIVENLQRKDLNALEKAASFQRYLEQYGGTQEELAARLRLDRSTIANLIRLLELPAAVQEAIRQGRITPGHARALLPLGDEREQVEFCQRIQQEGLSVRQVETLVQETIEQADAEPLRVVGRDGSASRARRLPSEHVAALEQQFRAALGTKVKLTHSSRGRGKLVIHFSSHEEFERVREHICGPAEPAAHTQVG